MPEADHLEPPRALADGRRARFRPLKATTSLAALHHTWINAPWFIGGAIDGASFRTYVEKALLPVLRPGDIVVSDNLGSHRSKGNSPTHPLSRRQAALPAKILNSGSPGKVDTER